MLPRTRSGARGSLAFQLLQAIAKRQQPQSGSLDHSSEEWLRNRRIDSLAYRQLELDSEAQSIYQAIFAAQVKALRDVITALEARGIEVIAFKGAEFLTRYFNSCAINVMADVDILIQHQDIDQARHVLRELDYQQAGVRNGELHEFAETAILDTEKDHYELVAFRRLDQIDLPPDRAKSFNSAALRCLIPGDDRTLLVMTVDVHHGVATNIDGAEFFARAIPSAAGHGLCMAPGDHLWFTVSRYYTQVAYGKRSLRDFAFLAAAVNDPQCDWDLVLDADARFDLGAALFYYLKFLDELAGGVVPDEVLEQTNPWLTSRNIDWGWQLSRLFDQPEPYPL